MPTLLKAFKDPPKPSFSQHFTKVFNSDSNTHIIIINAKKVNTVNERHYKRNIQIKRKRMREIKR